MMFLRRFQPVAAIAEPSQPCWTSLLAPSERRRCSIARRCAYQRIGKRCCSVQEKSPCFEVHFSVNFFYPLSRRQIGYLHGVEGSSGDHHLWTCMCALAGSPLVNNALLSLVSTTLKDLLQLRGIAAWFCSVYRTDRDTMTRVLHSARHIKPGIAEPDTILMKLQHRERKERFTVQGIIE
jgi:hypothetical protein